MFQTIFILNDQTHADHRHLMETHSFPNFFVIEFFSTLWHFAGPADVIFVRENARTEANKIYQTISDNLSPEELVRQLQEPPSARCDKLRDRTCCCSL
jgi:hypothetical protein